MKFRWWIVVAILVLVLVLGTIGVLLAASTVLFSDYPFTAKLSFILPRAMDRILFDFHYMEPTGSEAPLFPFGYGYSCRDDFTGYIYTYWDYWTLNPAPSNVSADSPVSDTDAEDGNVLRLKFSAGDSSAGPIRGPNLQSREWVHFGRFSARIKTPATQPSVGMVTGFFTYFNDYWANPLNPLDENNNGIADNSEIDIELLGAQPHHIWLTIWTDYQPGVGFRRVTRTINMRTGAILQTPKGLEHVHFLADPGFLFPYTIPGFDHTRNFYKYSFYWSANSVRFYVEDGTREILLWNFTDPDYIPTHPARFMFNLWHNEKHWHFPFRRTDPPLRDAFLKIDWAEYSALYCETKEDASWIREAADGMN